MGRFSPEIGPLGIGKVTRGKVFLGENVPLSSVEFCHWNTGFNLAKKGEFF